MKTFKNILENEGTHALKDLVFSDFKETTINNDKFRQILFTGTTQVVVMSIKPNKEIGFEKHSKDQIFIFFGSAKVTLLDKTFTVSDGSCVIIPAESNHNIVNNSEKELKLFTIYGQPEH